MPATATDRLAGITTSVAVKPPCVAVTSFNIPLTGLFALSSVALQEGDRVLVWQQTNAIYNGIYNASSSDWKRALDFDGARDVVTGTLVLVRNGVADGVIFEVVTLGDITIGVTPIVFRLRDNPLLTYPQTAAELAAGVTPTNYAYAPGHVYRYGTNTTPGTTDMTAAINHALAANTSVYAPANTYRITSTLSLISGQTFHGDGPSTILSYASGTISNIVGNTISNTIVRDLKIVVAGLNSGQSTGGVVFQNANYCQCVRVEMQGLGWAGVLLNTSNFCIVNDCYFHGWQNDQHDSADVAVYALSTHNIVENNICMGGGWHGVMVQNPFIGGSTFPKQNLVKGNRIGAHTSYGILFYNTDTATDCFNTAEGNCIENITGVNPSGAGGAGIYVANMGACVVIGNTINNVCTATTLSTLTPAGIGINSAAALGPFVVADNVIQDVNNFFGIDVINSGLGGIIEGNTVRLTVGTPVAGINLAGCNNVVVKGNAIQINNTLAGTVGIAVTANNQASANITLSDNMILGTAARGIDVDQSGGFNVGNLVITGNVITGGGAASIPLRLSSAKLATVSNNICQSGAAIAFLVTSSVQLRITNNTFTTTGTNSVNTIGVCTASYFDKTNFWNGTLINGATGLICEQFNPTAPATGTSAVGDMTEMSVPVVGSPKRWRCTVAGANPGSSTWWSEGNL